MDAGESGTRQSGFTSASRPDIFIRHHKDSAEKHFKPTPPNMAAATLMSPAPAYHPHTTPFPSSYHHPPPPQSSMSGMISPGAHSRRTSQDSEHSSQRQSLPSISEVFSSAKPTHYSPTTPTTVNGSQPLPPPPPFTTAPASRADPGTDSRHAVPPEDKFYRYPQHSDVAAHGSFAYGEQRDPTNSTESIQRNGSISSSRAPQAPYPQPGQLPPGQLPLSQAPPLSPRRMGPPPPHYEPHRQSLHSDAEYGMPRRYDPNSLHKHFEDYDYLDSLKRIATHSRTICNFAEAFKSIASEQHGGQPIPARLPNEREVTEMLGNVEYVRKTLENVRDIVQQSIANEKAREGGKLRGPYEDEDSMLYDGVKPHYNLGEVKKRRGRAAPPGRCHSCNRIDTPEWRRGPDGARTLCNACGLHYAKLERKRQMDQRIRPKVVE